MNSQPMMVSRGKIAPVEKLVVTNPYKKLCVNDLKVFFGVNDRHVILYEGKLENNPVILKYYCVTNKLDVTREMEISCKLRKLGCPIFWFSTSFFVHSTDNPSFKKPIMLMKKLARSQDRLLDKNDEYKLGLDVIEQLKYIHKIGVHCDLKPDNILYDNVKNYFYVIDYGGLTDEKLEDGYRRRVWSPNWASQDKDDRDNKICYFYHDLIELGYTINGYRLFRRNKGWNKKKIMNDFDPLLKRYMDEVEKIINEKIPRMKAYQLLEKILNENHKIVTSC